LSFVGKKKKLRETMEIEIFIVFFFFDYRSSVEPFFLFGDFFFSLIFFFSYRYDYWIEMMMRLFGWNKQKKTNLNSVCQDMSIIPKFELWDLKNTPKFAPLGKFTCKVLKVSDGDTIKLAFFHETDDEFPYRVTCRMYGYDTPEVYHPSCPEEKVEGYRCSDALKALLPVGRIVVAEFFKPGKYGRALVKIYVPTNDQIKSHACGYDIPKTIDVGENQDGPTYVSDMLCINDWCLKHIMCIEYEGDQKPTFEEMKKEYHSKRNGSPPCQCCDCIGEEESQEYYQMYGVEHENKETKASTKKRKR
jgi:hypothetical protein